MDTFQQYDASNVRDEKQAVQKAQQLVEGEDSELWQGEHLIARLSGLQKTTE